MVTTVEDPQTFATVEDSRVDGVRDCLDPLKPARLSWTLKCAKAVEALGRCMTVENPQTWQACCQSAEEGAVVVVNSNLIFERSWVQLLLFGGPF